ncbi:MAG: hypothetical protein EOM16_09130, partial [Bacteroidia bacterium]|nr:hypothetical protein [Bacteroidia bacterium]
MVAYDENGAITDIAEKAFSKKLVSFSEQAELTGLSRQKCANFRCFLWEKTSGGFHAIPVVNKENNLPSRWIFSGQQQSPIDIITNKAKTEGIDVTKTSTSTLAPPVTTQIQSQKPPTPTPSKSVASLPEPFVGPVKPSSSPTPPTPLQIVQDKFDASKPTKPKIETLTQQEYLQQTYDQQKLLGQAASTIQQQLQDINPAQMYIYTTPKGTEMTVTGAYLKNLLKRDVQQVQDYYTQSQLAFQEANKLDPRTVIKKEEGKYNIIPPDTSLDWTKKEFEKIDAAYDINPVLGGIAEYGFGAVSSIAATGQGIGSLVGLGKGLPHYVSSFDVALEPFGLAPKGTTEILADRPVFTTGQVAGEIFQATAGGYAGTVVKSGIKSGAKTGASAILSGAGKAYQKVSRFIPEESFLDEFVETVGRTGEKITTSTPVTN